MKWTEALPIALMSARSSVSSRTGFTPFELERGVPFPGPGAENPFNTPAPFLKYKPYFDQLKATLSVFSQQAISDTTSGDNPGIPNTAEWVFLKSIKRKWSEPRWTGPFQVVERTTHPVRLKGKGDAWYHWSQCTAVGNPQRTLEEIQKDLQETA